MRIQLQLRGPADEQIWCGKNTFGPEFQDGPEARPLEVLGSRHEIKSLRNIARSFKLFGSLHYTVQGIIA